MLYNFISGNLVYQRLEVIVNCETVLIRRYTSINLFRDQPPLTYTYVINSSTDFLYGFRLQLYTYSRASENLISPNLIIR